MTFQHEPLLYALLALCCTWLLLRRLRRRFETGRVVEVERRYDRTLEKFNVEIDRFKFARQSFVKVLLNHDHAIWTQVEELAGQEKSQREVLRLKVHRYVDEIVPFFKPLTYFSFGLKLARLLLNALFEVDVRQGELEAIKRFVGEKPRSVVYLMNHRSNVDYVLAAYVLAEKIALSFAVGEWARVWPLEYLFKSFGSYFLRRGERDPLYHTVLKRYVQTVTKNAVTQAMFPEGGLSRDGRLRAPKIGLIDAILCAKEDRSFSRELVFVPVAINYDRVLEDRALVRELKQQLVRDGLSTAPQRPHRRRGMIREVGHIVFSNATKFWRRRLRRHGVAVVRFGKPVSFDGWMADLGQDIFALPKEERRAHVARFCNQMMRDIAKLVPATPVTVVCRVLLKHKSIERGSLEHHVAEAIHHLRARGVEVVGDEHGVAALTDAALLRLQTRRVARHEGGVVSLVPGEEAIATYYANAIAHHEDGRVPEVEAVSGRGAA